MCKSKKENNYNEEYDRVVNNVNELKTNLGSLASSFFAEDGPFTELQDKARSLSSGFVEDARRHVHEAREEVQSMMEKEALFPHPYQKRLGKDEDDNWVRDNSWSNWHDRWHNSWRSKWRGKTPFGYYAYHAPSSRYYNDCLNKNGESVWDSEGYWRCLFPNSEVPNRVLADRNSSEILTKEDFNNAAAHANVKDGVYDLGAKGVYFKQFTDYLNWKNVMYENVRREKQQRLSKFKEQHTKSAPPQENSFTSYSIQKVFDTNDDGESFSETRTERFKDGSTRTTTTTKRKPFDAKDWITVEEKTDVNGDNLTSLAAQGKDHQNGWFWRK